ncbi:MAG: DUF2231 domain-containing protein [Mycobacterium sp.]
MSTVNGLPAHVLLVHFIVVLAPLTALLAILCAIWSSVRERLVWLVLALSVFVAVLTPITTEAGEWLEHKVGKSPPLHIHSHLGDTMIYFALALVVAALLLAVMHVRQHRGMPLTRVVSMVVVAFVLISSVATMVQVYRIGDSGARVSWGEL